MAGVLADVLNGARIPNCRETVHKQLAVPKLTGMGSVLATVMLTILGSAALGANDPEDGYSIKFRLIGGKGVPVCEAYLRRLNQAHFQADPFCGIPESDTVPGFESLERHYLSVAEIGALFNYVHAFMYYGDQHHADSIVDQDSQKTIDQYTAFGWLRVWKYAPTLDIENNGIPDNVIVWQGYGASDKGGHCGSTYDHKPWDFSLVEQRAFILSTDGKTIDEERTRAIFGAQVSGGALRATAESPFQPLSDSLGFFRYEGVDYIEADTKPVSRNTRAPLFVYRRARGQTTKVCEVQ